MVSGLRPARHLNLQAVGASFERVSGAVGATPVLCRPAIRCTQLARCAALPNASAGHALELRIR